ncbi:unnamed protein product [Prunus brigantina]
MLCFLQQTDNPDDSHECLERCMNAIYDLDKEVRQCYGQNIDYNKNELARIMLLDGCFILELFLRYYAKKPCVGEAPLSVAGLALMFFQPLSRKPIPKDQDELGTDFKHLLDLLHQFYFQLVRKMKHLTSSCLPEPNDTAINNKWGCNYCASELLESGIQFQIGSWEDHLLNITFSNGVISIPTDHRRDRYFSVQEPHCL